MRCKYVTTFSVNGKAVSEEQRVSVTSEADEPRHLESGTLNIYPDMPYQEIEGFGGALTESSAYLLSKLDSKTRRAALEEFFGENGNHLKFLRVPVDSCDYSLEEYTAVEDPMADPQLNTFSLKRDKQYIIPMLKEIMAISRGPLSILLSPWSPPACWKTPPAKPKNDASVYAMFGARMPEIDYETPSRCNGGSLKPEYYASWAKYLVKYVLAYLNEGIPVTMLSIQNESIAATMWDSCVWTAGEQKKFLKEYLYPEFEAQGIAGKVGIYVWDHNKERVLEYVSGVIDGETDGMVEGIAFHWYSGDHFESVEMTAKKFPGKVLMMSECCLLHPPGKSGFMGFGGTDTPGTAEHKDAAAYAHDIIGNLNAGMNRWIDWNLFVDKDGGPRHVPGGFTGDAIIYDDGTYRKCLIYDYIRHFSKYIMPGAVRIGHSRCDDKIEMTAAKNPDGSIVAVILNKQYEDAQYAVRMDGRVIRISAPAGTISTLLITEEEES
jgi:glucosylceramidase